MQEDTLLQQLSDDIGMARQLLELTEDEYLALNERDLARLESLLAEKQPLLALLAQHATLRSQLLASKQLPADRAGLERFVAGLDEGDEILRQADALGSILEACQASNLRNGRLIRANQATLNGMLDILRGGSDTPGLYNSQGSTAKNNPGRPLSQA